jgi:hypothetical protein
MMAGESVFVFFNKQTNLLTWNSFFICARSSRILVFQIDRSWKVKSLACIFRVANWRLDDNRSSSNEKCVIDGARQARVQT